MQACSEVISRILRYALWDDASGLEPAFFAEISTEQWNDVHTLALRQGVVAMMLDGIIRSGLEIPRPVKMRFISSTDKLERGYTQKFRLAQELAQTYSTEGIEMMLLKGIGLSQLYPTPKHRPCSDIDIYLMGAQREGDRLVRKRFGVKINHGHHHHTTFHIKGILVENHYDFIEAHSRRSKSRLETYLKELSAMESPAHASLKGVDVLLPAPNLNALFLTLHAADHFAAENISIRHLTDWAMFLRSHHAEVDWQRLYALAEEFGFREFLDVINSICIIYIGMPAEFAPSQSNDPALVQRSWEDCMEYKLKRLPKSFFKGWIFRIARRHRNGWKRRMITSESTLSTLFYSVVSHLVHPTLFRR